jgi:MGT family glycosyltransferase
VTESKRFSFVTWDGGGNVAPELSVARRLVERGHRVRVLADPTLEGEVREAGAEFAPWTSAPHRRSLQRGEEVFKDYEIKNPLKMLDAYLRDFLSAPAPRWAQDTLAELTGHPADAVVVDFAIPAALIAVQELALPSATIMPNIWVVPTRGIPPLGPGFLPATNVLGQLRDRALYSFTRRLFNKALPALNQVRVAHGLAPVSNVYEQFLAADRILVQTSPAFDLSSPHLPKHVVYTGPVLADPVWSERWQSPFAPDDARPLVLVGLSSTFQDQVQTLNRIVQALSGLPLRAIVTLGPALEPSEVRASDNVVVVRSAPHSQILEQAALLITHAGHGTTLKGLAAGVPLVCLPMGRDQNDTAARVVYRGAGVRLAPSSSSERIRAAVERVLGAPGYKQAALGLQRAIRTREGCVDAVEVLEGLARRSPRAAA